MKDLVLHVKGIYFDQIKAGTKHFEYRLVTPYWTKRLAGREYRNVIIARGYPKCDDMDKHITIPWMQPDVTKLVHSHFGPDVVRVYAINVRNAK